MATPGSIVEAAPGATPAGAGIDFETTKEIGYYKLVWRRFRTRRIALWSVAFLLLITFCSVVIPWFLPPDQANPGHSFESMSLAHPFGTDEVGADLFTRVLLGGRISLMVGFLAMAVTMIVATLVGAISGYLGGVVDAVLSALTNAVLSMPSLLILIIYAEIVGQGQIATVVTGIAFISWPFPARIVRSVVLGLREKEFVEAVRALGTSRMRIILRHILPNALGVIIVSASLTIAAAILTESALSFLGVGIGAPIATWGALLNGGQDAITSHNDFFYSLWPGLCILFTVLCFNYLGDALNDAFDPRSLER